MDPRPVIYLTVVAAIFGTGWKLRDYQADSAELLVQKVKEEARLGTAEAIAKIEIKYTTVNRRLEKEVIKELVYTECRHSPEAFAALNEALSPPK
jgi:hypothetical protein